MDSIMKQLSRVIHYIAQVILLLMAILITLDVLSRWILKAPITGTVDFTELGLSLVIFLSLAYTHVREGHITIDFVIERFSTRIQWIFESVINLLITGLMLLVAWSTCEYAIRLFYAHTVTGDLRIPLFPIAMLAVIGTMLFALTAFLHAIHYLQKVVHSNES
ncbi:TRAP transporter small permease subunit [Agaribacter marinus]|uniref:TRAP transporter small permease n=1 Tax=Virgibacillus salarius TaxID=447199 RepID=A0A941I923_9BACI|nr:MULTISPECIES: TRAP transporter small permease [Bacillaceae]MBR7796279.1 TRAP transporter small permease [Virgibacillus salarius]NAZ08987.1 TRAP transporter small permease subunit [Agaribacter marinus]WBX79867.1 TRAP transporter small permease [Virgibacillus salarius]